MKPVRQHVEDAIHELVQLDNALSHTLAAATDRRATPEDVLHGCSVATASLRVIDLKLSVVREHYIAKGLLRNRKQEGLVQ